MSKIRMHIYFFLLFFRFCAKQCIIPYINLHTEPFIFLKHIYAGFLLRCVGVKMATMTFVASLALSGLSTN